MSSSRRGRRCPQVDFLAPTRARVELPGLRRLPDPAQFQQFVVGPEVARQQPAVGDAAVDGEVAGERLRQGFLPCIVARSLRSEEHTSELQSLMRIPYAAFCLKKKNNQKENI